MQKNVPSLTKVSVIPLKAQYYKILEDNDTKYCGKNHSSLPQRRLPCSVNMRLCYLNSLRAMYELSNFLGKNNLGVVIGKAARDPKILKDQKKRDLRRTIENCGNDYDTSSEQKLLIQLESSNSTSKLDWFSHVWIKVKSEYFDVTLEEILGIEDIQKARYRQGKILAYDEAILYCKDEPTIRESQSADVLNLKFSIELLNLAKQITGCKK